MNDNIWNQTSPRDLDMNIRPGMALALLGCIFVICMLATGALSFLIGRLLDGNMASAVRISSLVQDVVLFVVPAVATAVIATRRPAALLHLLKAPGLLPMLLVAVIMLVSIPALEGVIYWNYHWDWLPEGLAAAARALEETAAATMMAMMGSDSVMALIVNLLIVAVGAGVCEELIFRGAFLGLLLRTRLNVHVAVWLVALIFSLMHMQLFGSVPRMLLGAWFGYLLVWSRSLWLPVAAHVLNNAAFTVSAWWQVRHGQMPESEPTLWSPLWIGLSVLLTATVVLVLKRIIPKEEDGSSLRCNRG